MEMHLNFYALFQAVGFVQAITLGSLLIFLHKRKHKSSLFLGIFLILFALGIIPSFLGNLKLLAIYPELYFLPFDFFWLHFPLFFIYTQQIGSFKENEIKYWVLYPGLVAFLLQLSVFFMPYEIKLAISQSWAYDLYKICMIFYGLSIGFYTLKILSDHKIKVHNYFSLVESRELTWELIFLIFNISGFIIHSIVTKTISESNFTKTVFLIYHLAFIYWASYHGVKQQNVQFLLLKKEKFESVQEKIPEKTSETQMTDQSMIQLMNEIDKYMMRSESFTNPELTIVDLAEEFKLHPKRISATVNTVENRNFNSYVNHFRVKKAETLLKGVEMKSLSIEGIGKEAGFHSKSAFYSAFKKENGTTPLKFKRHLAA